MNLVTTGNTVPAMSANDIGRVRELESALLTMPQVEMETQHVFHAGTYARTICLRDGLVITGALVKIPTILIINGDATVFLGDRTERITGHCVMLASAGRKQAFVAHTDTWITMVFATDAKTVEEAERQFTDEYELLISNTNQNEVIQCQAQQQ